MKARMSRNTRTEQCGHQLVGAQTCINRAVFELNSRENSNPPGRGRAPDDDYTLNCVLNAMQDLAAAAKVLLGKRGARA